MAETPADADALVKKEPEAVPAKDPIVSTSTSGILLVSALLLMAVLAWALYDEAYGQRPWKDMQRTFVARETSYLKRLKRNGNQTEKEVKESPEYQQLASDAQTAKEAAEPERKEIEEKVRVIDQQLAAITDDFQNKRGKITVANYKIETASASAKDKLRREVEQERQEQIKIKMPADDGSGRTEEQKFTYPELETKYLQLKDDKAQLLAHQADVLKNYNDLAKKRDEYLKDHITGLTDDQITKLIERNNHFDYTLRQINVTDANIVDRCETCHLGIREPLTITPATLKLRGKKPDEDARAFVSHPSKELLQIHDPEKFGCSSCHGGNGRATTDVVKAHGLNPFWLHPLHERDNMEAGCQQCHSNDRVLDFAPNLTLGKDLFQQRGCVGCHRFEGYDRETDGLSNARQTIKQLEEQMTTNDRESRQAVAASATVTDDAEAQKLLARAEKLKVDNSQIAARIEQLNTQSRYLMQDQKKVGPNLKDVRLKLRKEWIPVWLQNPQAFRPGTKMPTFWYLNEGHELSKKYGDKADQERKAIAAYLWQSAFEGQVSKQDAGNASHGEELFKTKGCMACHSIGDADNQVGGTFAANLQRVGEKANFEYIVRWIYNPRERWSPYCPKEKRDLTREDYEKNNKPYVFDTGMHSKCPNDGAELQVQNMTVMPNFRLSQEDARDLATYLFSLSSGHTSYPDASYMDDPNLKNQGFTLIKQYGCAGCHEIKGFEEEQRIGKELTAEGSTPIERLDFALMTQPAEQGLDPLTLKKTDSSGKKVSEWYNHKGFFEHKLTDPSIYDRGKEKDWKDHLRMPQPYLTPEWKTALTTFLLGSVGPEGANVPASMFYNPKDRGRDIQDGWWIIKKYNCMGCHTVQVGQKSVLSTLPQFQTQDGKEQLPPALTTEGARVDPNWLLRFLTDPSLSGGGSSSGDLTAPGHTGMSGANGSSSPQPSAAERMLAGESGASGNQPRSRANANNADFQPQPGANHNGVRLYLKPRMPTFNFSPNELRTLVRFFLAVSSQQEPYIKEQLEPLTDQERNLAREIFGSRSAPCLKCHLTGNPEHDKSASAPNFLMASERLKPGWTFRWLLDPQRVIPGTAMPSDLFKKDGERWVFNSTEQFKSAENYHGDEAQLLTRYILQLTPAEQARLASSSPSAPSGRTQTGDNQNTTAASSTHHARRNHEKQSRFKHQASARAPSPASESQRARDPAIIAMVRHLSLNLAP